MYAYELNNIMNKAVEQGDFTLESLCLQLEGMISNGEATTEKIMDNVIEFLYSLVD